MKSMAVVVASLVAVAVALAVAVAMMMGVAVARVRVRAVYSRYTHLQVGALACTLFFWYSTGSTLLEISSFWK